MRQTIKLSGILRYEPNRGEDFKKQFKSKTLVVDLGGGSHNQIDLYYQWFLQKKFGSCLKIQRPMFGNHITVVRGDEIPLHSDKWKKYEGRRVNFEFSPALKLNYQFWSLPVKSNELLFIRQELGLFNSYNFHLTVGRQFHWQPLNGEN